MPKLGKFFYVEKGEGEKGEVVFIHGAGGNHQSWAYQIKEPAEGFRFIVLDLPGHGRSEGETYNSAEGYANEVVEFIEERKLNNIVSLVGHSLGGCIAVWMYLKGITARSLVLVSSGLKLWGARKLSRPIDKNSACDNLFFDWKLRVQCKKGNIGLFNQEFEDLNKDLEAAQNCDLRKFADKIDVPVLLIYGYYDRMFPRWAVEETYYLLKNARMIGVESSHMPMIERPKEFNRYLAEFLESLA